GRLGRVAAPLRLLKRVARRLGRSTAIVLRSLGRRPSAGTSVTQEEIKVLITEGIRAGIFEGAEHEMIKRVLRLGDQRASALMTPMAEVVWIDVAAPPDAIKRKIAESPHSRFPVCDGSIDNVEGIVQVKDLLAHVLAGNPLGIRGLLKIPLFLYE